MKISQKFVEDRNLPKCPECNSSNISHYYGKFEFCNDCGHSSSDESTIDFNQDGLDD